MIHRSFLFTILLMQFCIDLFLLQFICVKAFTAFTTTYTNFEPYREKRQHCSTLHHPIAITNTIQNRKQTCITANRQQRSFLMMSDPSTPNFNILDGSSPMLYHEMIDYGLSSSSKAVTNNPSTTSTSVNKVVQPSTVMTSTSTTVSSSTSTATTSSMIYNEVIDYGSAATTTSHVSSNPSSTTTSENKVMRVVSSATSSSTNTITPPILSDKAIDYGTKATATSQTAMNPSKTTTATVTATVTTSQNATNSSTATATATGTTTSTSTGINKVVSLNRQSTAGASVTTPYSFPISPVYNEVIDYGSTTKTTQTTMNPSRTTTTGSTKVVALNSQPTAGTSTPYSLLTPPVFNEVIDYSSAATSTAVRNRPLSTIAPSFVNTNSVGMMKTVSTKKVTATTTSLPIPSSSIQMESTTVTTVSNRKPSESTMENKKVLDGKITPTGSTTTTTTATTPPNTTKSESLPKVTPTIMTSTLPPKSTITKEATTSFTTATRKATPINYLQPNAFSESIDYYKSSSVSTTFQPLQPSITISSSSSSSSSPAGIVAVEDFVDEQMEDYDDYIDDKEDTIVNKPLFLTTMDGLQTMGQQQQQPATTDSNTLFPELPAFIEPESTTDAISQQEQQTPSSVVTTLTMPIQDVQEDTVVVEDEESLITKEVDDSPLDLYKLYGSISANTVADLPDVRQVMEGQENFVVVEQVDDSNAVVDLDNNFHPPTNVVSSIFESTLDSSRDEVSSAAGDDANRTVNAVSDLPDVAVIMKEEEEEEKFVVGHVDDSNAMVDLDNSLHPPTNIISAVEKSLDSTIDVVSSAAVMSTSVEQQQPIVEMEKVLTRIEIDEENEDDEVFVLQEVHDSTSFLSYVAEVPDVVEVFEEEHKDNNVVSPVDDIEAAAAAAAAASDIDIDNSLNSPNHLSSAVDTSTPVEQEQSIFKKEEALVIAEDNAFTGEPIHDRIKEDREVVESLFAATPIPSNELLGDQPAINTMLNVDNASENSDFNDGEQGRDTDFVDLREMGEEDFQAVEKDSILSELRNSNGDGTSNRVVAKQEPFISLTSSNIESVAVNGMNTETSFAVTKKQLKQGAARAEPVLTTESPTMMVTPQKSRVTVVKPAAIESSSTATSDDSYTFPSLENLDRQRNESPLNEVLTMPMNVDTSIPADNQKQDLRDFVEDISTEMPSTSKAERIDDRMVQEFIVENHNSEAIVDSLAVVEELRITEKAVIGDEPNVKEYIVENTDSEAILDSLIVVDEPRNFIMPVSGDEFCLQEGSVENIESETIVDPLVVGDEARNTEELVDGAESTVQESIVDSIVVVDEPRSTYNSIETPKPYFLRYVDERESFDKQPEVLAKPPLVPPPITAFSQRRSPSAISMTPEERVAKADESLLSFEVKKDVQPETIKGAAIATFVLASMAGDDLAITLFGMVPAMSYFTLTRGKTGETMRIIGDISWMWTTKFSETLKSLDGVQALRVLNVIRFVTSKVWTDFATWIDQQSLSADIEYHDRKLAAEESNVPQVEEMRENTSLFYLETPEQIQEKEMNEINLLLEDAERERLLAKTKEEQKLKEKIQRELLATKLDLDRKAATAKKFMADAEESRRKAEELFNLKKISEAKQRSLLESRLAINRAQKSNDVEDEEGPTVHCNPIDDAEDHSTVHIQTEANERALLSLDDAEDHSAAHIQTEANQRALLEARLKIDRSTRDRVLQAEISANDREERRNDESLKVGFNRYAFGLDSFSPEVTSSSDDLTDFVGKATNTDDEYQNDSLSSESIIAEEMTRVEEENRIKRIEEQAEIEEFNRLAESSRLDEIARVETDEDNRMAETKSLSELVEKEALIRQEEESRPASAEYLSYISAAEESAHQEEEKRKAEEVRLLAEIQSLARIEGKKRLDEVVSRLMDDNGAENLIKDSLNTDEDAAIEEDLDHAPIEVFPWGNNNQPVPSPTENKKPNINSAKALLESSRRGEMNQFERGWF